MNTFNIQNQNSSQKTAFGVSRVNIQAKKDKQDALKNSMIAISALGVVGLATFLILSRRPQKVKTTISELGLVFEQECANLPVQSTLKKIPEYSKDLVGEASAKINNFYAFLKRNPAGFYLENGKEINKFLRTGELTKPPILQANVPTELLTFVKNKITETQNLNRAIVDSVEILDNLMVFKTKSPMTVYRDAPASWIEAAKNGIIKEEAFLSTSTVPGPSMEGMLGGNPHLNKRYKILLPEKFPFLDLTYTSEKEMLLPRGLSLRILGNDTLAVIV